MKILTLWQPWASAIALGAKRIETRSWSTKYRGPIAIHAAKRFVPSEMRALLQQPCWRGALRLEHELDDDMVPPTIPRGAIVAVADLVDCRPTESFDAAILDALNHQRFAPLVCFDWTERQMGDFAPGRFGWVRCRVARPELRRHRTQPFLRRDGGTTDPRRGRSPLQDQEGGANGMIVEHDLTMVTTAAFSECRTYRYRLGRHVGPQKTVVTFVMLNPSTADALKDDPTIRRCIGFASSWGFGRLEVVNLFALRSTNPRALERHHDPIGPENHDAINAACKDSSLIICAWGTWGVWRQRGRDVRLQIAARGHRMHHLGLTDGGQPRHPLYLKADTKPILWEEAIQ